MTFFTSSELEAAEWPDGVVSPGKGHRVVILPELGSAPSLKALRLAARIAGQYRVPWAFLARPLAGDNPAPGWADDLSRSYWAKRKRFCGETNPDGSVDWRRLVFPPDFVRSPRLSVIPKAADIWKELEIEILPSLHNASRPVRRAEAKPDVAPPPAPPKEWFDRSAQIEGDAEVGAGVPPKPRPTRRRFKADGWTDSGALV